MDDQDERREEICSAASLKRKKKGAQVGKKKRQWSLAALRVVEKGAWAELAGQE